MRQQAPIPPSLSLSRRLFRFLLVLILPMILLYLVQAPNWVNQMGFNLVPVSGRVTLEGEPVVSAKVLFVPIEQSYFSSELAPVSVGRTDPRGEFTLSTIQGSAGAVSGRHLVFITTLERSDKGIPLRPEVIPADFQEEVEVTYFGSQPFTFDLKLQSPSKKK